MSGIFFDTYRADDIFSRRSVLELISVWVEQKLFVVVQNEEKNTLKLSIIERILKNAIIDFDWETRLSCVHILLVIAQTHGEKSLGFFCSIFDFVIHKSLFDVEMKVQEQTMQWLHKLQCNLDHVKMTEPKISNILEFKTHLEEYQKNGEKYCIETLRRFVLLFDFSRTIDNLEAMDEYVQNDSVSFMDDILSSVNKKDENLLVDCY